MCCDEGATSGDEPGAGTLRSVSGPSFAGVDVDAYSFTAGADYGIHAATMTGFIGDSFDMSIDVVASDGTTRVEAEDEDRATGSASITGDTIVAVVEVDPEQGAPEWDVIAGIGVFTGSFIIKL